MSPLRRPHLVDRWCARRSLSNGTDSQCQLHFVLSLREPGTLERREKRVGQTFWHVRVNAPGARRIDSIQRIQQPKAPLTPSELAPHDYGQQRNLWTCGIDDGVRFAVHFICPRLMTKSIDSRRLEQPRQVGGALACDNAGDSR